MQYILYSLTCFCAGIVWRLFANVSPCLYHETRLTSLYIVISRNLRTAPNGSLPYNDKRTPECPFTVFINAGA